MVQGMQTLEFTLNGQARSVEIRAGESLLETLRTRCGVYSTKDGCQPQGQCGCCLALIDGLPKVTCAVPAERVQGKEVLTLEGLSEEERRLIADCFVATAGLQCGFCIPGFALQAKHLLDKNPSPSRDEIAKALTGHLCRCTGYIKIFDAIELLAAARRGEAQPVLVEDGRVGSSLARSHRPEHDPREIVPTWTTWSGLACCTGPSCSPQHPRAKVLRIDTSKALRLSRCCGGRHRAGCPGRSLGWLALQRLACLRRRRRRGAVRGRCAGCDAAAG